MTMNVSRAERIARLSFGIVMLALIPFGPKTWWGLLGLVPLITGLVGFCPLRRLMGQGSSCCR